MTREEREISGKQVDAADKKFEEYHEDGQPIPAEGLVLLAQARRLLKYADEADKEIKKLVKAGNLLNNRISLAAEHVPADPNGLALRGKILNAMMQWEAALSAEGRKANG